MMKAFNARSNAAQSPIPSYWPIYPLKINNFNKQPLNHPICPNSRPYLPRLREYTPTNTMTNAAIILDLVVSCQPPMPSPTPMYVFTGALFIFSNSARYPVRLIPSGKA